MAYREVTMIEIKEVLRQWQAGAKHKRIARCLGMDPKTVRRYVRVAEDCGLEIGGELTDEQLGVVLEALRPAADRQRGASWEQCEVHRDFIGRHLSSGVRLSKVRRLLVRQGVVIPTATMYRFAAAELGFGRRAPTVPVVDGEPGEEIELDTGWMTMLEPDARGRRRRFRAWIFTPRVSRYRFVYPCFRETTQSAIEACEAAWTFYGGVFGVVIPDNTKAIVDVADPLGARIVEGFLEYAQARGFGIDPTRVRRPTDKARVERSVSYTRDDCFGGERLTSIEQCRERARVWCEREAGVRRHSRTQRIPREHFEAEERPRLLAPPTEPYDIPLWREPKVARDQHAQVERGLYSLPTRYVGKTLRARADQRTVRFYDGRRLVKTHRRVSPGGRATDPEDFPVDKRAYALRDVHFLEREAARAGQAVGLMAIEILAVPLPWTRMRRVYALLGLVRRFGAERVEEVCRTALAADMTDVRRLRRMLELATPPPEPPPPSKVIPIGRYLRSPSQYALRLQRPEGGER